VKLKTRVLGENHSSRKGSPCSCENYDFDGRLLIQFLEKLRQPGEHIPGEGIESFRSVESDNGNSTAEYFKLYLILSLFCHGIDKLLLPLCITSSNPFLSDIPIPNFMIASHSWTTAKTQRTHRKKFHNNPKV
jgi:hypothetical protein